MIACTIGMMVPEKLLASVTITSTTGTVTINSEKAGDLAAYLETASSDQIDALKASTIVFVGKFNSSDLEALDSKGCCVATTVNMSGAKFIKAPSNSNTLLYHDNYPETASEGTMCIVGSVKKKSAAERAWSYIETDQVPQDQINNAVIVDELPSEVPQTHDVYYRIPKTFNYYKVVEENYNRTYQVVNEEDISGEATIHPTATPSQMITEDNKNNFLYGYQDVNNNRIEVRVGDYVKVAATFDYYTNPATLKWVNADSDYNDGDPLGEYPWYASESTAEAPTDNNQTQTAYIGGTQYIRYQDDWTTDLSSVGEQYDYSQMKFTYWKNTITKAITSNYVPGTTVITKDAFAGCTQLQEAVLNSGIIGPYILGQNLSDHPNLTKVTIGSGVTELLDNAFNKLPITDLDWANATSLEIIGEYAFQECLLSNVSTLTIPSSVKTIKDYAFFNICKDLTAEQVNNGKGVQSIVFPADSHLDEGEGIGDHAFWLESTTANPLKDVYVNANKEIPCHKEAFSHWNTDGQTQVTQTGARTRLHYPSTYFDFYVGDYKNDINGGYIVGQGDMITSRNSQYRTNGWQKFISGGILMAPDVTWRSFSDDVPYYVPGEANGRKTEVYLVDGYDSSKGAKLVRMKIGDLIPAHTGVIVHFEFDSDQGAVLYLPAALKEITVMDEEGNPVLDEEGNPITKKIVDPDKLAEAPYDTEADATRMYQPTGKTGSYNNYLKYLNKQTVRIENVEIVGGKKTYRNYFFCNNAELAKEENARWRGDEWSAACLQGWGFLRAVSGSYTISNKAYLHFPATERFPGSESVGVQEDHSTDTNSNASSAKQFGFTTFNEDGEEFDCMPHLNGIATNVQSVVETTVNDDFYYNMQGMKVDNPSKGIYVKNGKKYVVK